MLQAINEYIYQKITNSNNETRHDKQPKTHYSRKHRLQDSHNGLATRLKAVIYKIISSTQSGFLKGKSIHNHICLVLDLIDYSHLFNDFMLFLDFNKTFDLVEDTFLLTHWDILVISFLTWSLCYILILTAAFPWQKAHVPDSK